MKKDEFITQDEMKEIGIMVIKELSDLGFSEEEVEDILTTSAKYEAYNLLIERRMREKEESSKKKNTKG